MPSTATPLLRLELQATGEDVNTWGIHLNSSVFTLLDSAIAGRTYIDNPTSGMTLSSVNYAPDQARQPVLQFSGTGGATVFVGATTKIYLIRDYTAGDIIFGTMAGTTVTLPKSGYMPVTITTSGAEDARVYELNPAHAPTNPGGIVTRTSLGITLSGTGMPSGYTPIYNSSVTTKLYVDAAILASALSGILPGQTGNAGKFLATDGTSLNWSGTNAIQLGRHTIYTRAVGWTTRSTSGASVNADETAGPNYNMLDGYDFISSANRYIQTEITPPVSFSGGTIPVTLEFLAFSTTGTVYWGIQAVYVTSGGSYTQSYGSAALVSHAITGSGLRQVTAEVNVTVSGTWVSGNSILWQIYRSGVGASSLNMPARLRGVNMYPSINRPTDAL